MLFFNAQDKLWFQSIIKKYTKNSLQPNNS